MILGGDTVSVLRAPATSTAYGQVWDWSAAQVTTLTGCSLQPVTEVEDTEGRATTVTTWRLFTPPADVRESDRVRIDSADWEVTQVLTWRQGPDVDHLEIQLRQVVG